MVDAAADQPGDFVVGTGESHTVQDFVEVAFNHAKLDWRKYVKSDPTLMRPSEVDHLVADASKAREILKWKPRVSFQDLVTMMVDADLARVEKMVSANTRL